MKTMICLIVMLAISKYASAAVCTMAITNYCQTCDGAACGSCYNWGNGTYADKNWAAQNSVSCSGDLPLGYKVTNCLINAGYGSALLYPTSTVSASSHPRCLQCDGKKFLHYSTAATTETCTDTAPTDMASCVEISDCMQTICKTNATTAYGCNQCAYDKYPTGVSTTTLYNTSCGAVVTAIANCQLYSYSVSGTTITYTCKGCNEGYSANYTYTACTAFTDKGCKTLQSDGTSCGECWWSYAFSGATCLLRSYVGAFIGLISFVALLLVQ